MSSDHRSPASTRRRRSAALSTTFSITLGAAAMLAGTGAHAALNTYTSDGVQLVYNTETNKTWTQDAHLLKSFIQSMGYDAITQAIVAVTPTIEDHKHVVNPLGTYRLQANWRDFMGTDIDLGDVSWYGAIAFVNYLNSIEYGGSNRWRLPDVDDGIVRDTSVFSNAQWVYWTDRTDSYYLYQGWYLNTFNGAHSIASKDNYFTAWAVTDGMVSSVPAPAAAWLLLAGLPLVAGAARRARRTPASQRPADADDQASA